MSVRARVLPLVAVLASVVAIGCGDSSDDAETPATTAAPVTTATTDTTATTGGAGDTAAGKTVFSASCAGCHTLADAGSSGTTGPNLDERKPDAAAVAAKVQVGGGAMPAFGEQGILNETQIADVAAYVSSVAGK